jgi:integrase/recombinase XerD
MLVEKIQFAGNSSEASKGCIALQITPGTSIKVLKDKVLSLHRTAEFRFGYLMIPISPSEDSHQLLAQAKGAFGEHFQSIELVHANVSPTGEALPSAHADGLERYAQMMKKRRYSSNTVRNYVKALRQFFVFIMPASPSELDSEQVCAAVEQLAEARGIAVSYHNLVINAVRLYYEEIEERPRIQGRLLRLKDKVSLPKVLTKDEVQLLFSAATNPKQRCILLMLYGMGLRVSELLALQRTDLDLKAQLLTIKGTRGRKPRNLSLPSQIQLPLQTYLAEYNPWPYIFQGRKEGQPFSERGLQANIHQLAVQAGLNKQVTPHMLRHSFATHSLESGASLHFLQALLGHNSIKSTTNYMHVARIQRPQSPLEGIGI